MESMRTGKVDLLLIVGGNPVYNTPGELDFGKYYEQVKLPSTRTTSTRRRSSRTGTSLPPTTWNRGATHGHLMAQPRFSNR